MGFLDKARAMADELAQKADTAMAGSGFGGPTAGAERYLRDLGVIAYLEANGRSVPADDRDRVMSALRELEQRGAIGSLTLQTTAEQPTAPPPPPGAVAAQEAAAQAGAVPPPPAAATPSDGTPAEPVGGAADVAPPPAPAEPTTETDTSTATAPPPPPPSWAKGD